MNIKIYIESNLRCVLHILEDVMNRTKGDFFFEERKAGNKSEWIENRKWKEKVSRGEEMSRGVDGLEGERRKIAGGKYQGKRLEEPRWGEVNVGSERPRDSQDYETGRISRY